VLYQNTFCKTHMCFAKTLMYFQSVGPVHPYWRDTIPRLHKKSFLVIGDYKNKWNRAKIFFLLRPKVLLPPYFPQSSVFLVSSTISRLLSTGRGGLSSNKSTILLRWCNTHHNFMVLLSLVSPSKCHTASQNLQSLLDHVVKGLGTINQLEQFDIVHLV